LSLRPSFPAATHAFLCAIHSEAGIGPTSWTLVKDDPNAMAAPAKDTFFTDVALTPPEGGVRWIGMVYKLPR